MPGPHRSLAGVSGGVRGRRQWCRRSPMTRPATPAPTSPPRPAPSAPGAAEQKRLLRKAILASSIGNATEWYDYGVYAVVATYLTHAFFPGTLGNIGTMAGFAVSFVLRPLGGMVWGPIGDRFGRKAVDRKSVV